uniref:Uncharacterized protein n=1 Tax=Arundo donax TaxID=35708 RepID=A0A0A9TGY0_ARUDO
MVIWYMTMIEHISFVIWHAFQILFVEYFCFVPRGKWLFSRTSFLF